MDRRDSVWSSVMKAVENWNVELVLPYIIPVCSVQLVDENKDEYYRLFFRSSNPFHSKLMYYINHTFNKSFLLARNNRKNVRLNYFWKDSYDYYYTEVNMKDYLSMFPKKINIDILSYFYYHLWYDGILIFDRYQHFNKPAAIELCTTEKFTNCGLLDEDIVNRKDFPQINENIIPLGFGKNKYQKIRYTGDIISILNNMDQIGIPSISLMFN
jgi:hypothetical protein